LRGATVTTMVGLPPTRPVVPETAQQPSIVISLELESEEPTAVGVHPPMAPVEIIDIESSSDEGTPVKEPPAGAVRSGSGVHESLIINLDREVTAANEPAPLHPPAPTREDTGIRPAARPLGKSVVPTVARAKARTAPVGRPTLPDETPPPPRRRPP
jgi:hypothetical protein